MLRHEIDKLFNEHRAEYERALLDRDPEWFERQADALRREDKRTPSQTDRARFDVAVAKELEILYYLERAMPFPDASTSEDHGGKLSAIERAEAERQDSLSEKERAQRERKQRAWLKREEPLPLTEAEKAQQRQKQVEAVSRYRAQKKPPEPAMLTPSGKRMKRMNVTAQEILASVCERLGSRNLPNGHLLVEDCRFENKERACEAIRDTARLHGLKLRDARMRDPLQRERK